MKITDLEPNPWNPNRMNPDTLESERASIAEYGFIDPVTVRPHPKAKAKWQIIDGEHRWLAARNAGLTTIPVIVLDLDDVAAKKLTLIMNETRGEADRIELGKVLADLQRAGADLAALDFSPQEIADLVAIADVEWNPDEAGTGEREDESGEYHTVTAKIPKAQWPTVEHRLAGVIETVVKGAVAEDVAVGRALVYLLRVTNKKGS